MVYKIATMSDYAPTSRRPIAAVFRQTGDAATRFCVRHVDGWLGSLFDWFRGMDAPYNLLPSLHAAFTLILCHIYFRYMRGFTRVAIMTWFVLIGLSPVLTYQHHLVDIFGGFVLAGYCFYFFRDSPRAQPGVVNYRIGSYYATGAAVLVLMGAISWPWYGPIEA